MSTSTRRSDFTPRRVVRLRSLTPGQRQRLAVLQRMANLLDSAFVVPGTSYRIGLDPLFGLVPGLGDLVSPLFAIGMLWHARDLNLPKVVQLRMIVNVAIDALVGVVPFAGDLFDVAWKANNRNYALLERHAYEEREAAPGDWAFVIVTTLLLLALAALPIALAAWLISLL